MIPYWEEINLLQCKSEQYLDTTEPRLSQTYVRKTGSGKLACMYIWTSDISY